jgi:hypothetical protein
MPNAECRMPKASARLNLRLPVSFGIRHWAFGIVVSVASSVVATPAAAAIIDRVLAVVNGQVLMQSDVYAAMAIGLVNTDGAQDPIASALGQLVERELVLAEVDRYAPPEPPESEIAARVKQVQGRFPSLEAFKRALDVAGLGEDRLRTIQRDELRIQTYVNQRFGAASAERDKAIADWTAGLRRRADVAINLGRTLTFP